jgi:ABC-2 type transport system ATP-binding protein
MRQRLLLAQALMGGPDLLVLDEPANGLDPGEVRAVREALRERAARGVAVLLSTHLLAEVELTCDRAVVLDRGRLVADAPVADLLTRGGTLEESFLGLLGRER